ncbi:MAG: sulfotransferase [Actinobacteria bacterium]|nr:sulfotransferase [Actinomycetota bacterium]MBW3648958.1 sulfotransferase [Actinomycetota bacterium]
MTTEHLRAYLGLERLCRNPVFVIGSPRSGTTALAKALGGHPELWASKESYFVHELFGNGRLDRVWKGNMERATPSWIREEAVERDEFLAFVGLAVNAIFSSRSGGRRWVDQTPLYTAMAQDLAVMLPGAQFVHILRDGRAVVRSMGSFEGVFTEGQRSRLSHEVPGWVHDFGQACAVWSEWVDTALALEEAIPDRCLTVRNEDLAAEPEAGFDRLQAFLGLRPHGGPAEAFGGNRVNSSFQHDGRRPADDWSEWGPSRRKQFAELAGPMLVRAGYVSDEELDTWQSSEAT